MHARTHKRTDLPVNAYEPKRCYVMDNPSKSICFATSGSCKTSRNTFLFLSVTFVERRDIKIKHILWKYEKKNNNTGKNGPSVFLCSFFCMMMLLVM